MLNVSKPSADRVDINLSGALDADEMSAALDAILEVSKDITHGKLLYRISDFAMPTLGAMAIEFQRMPQLLPLIKTFDRCAVLSDTAWIRTASELEGALIPSLKIKSFALSDVAAAEAWLDGDAQPDSKEPEEDNFPV